MRILVLLSLLAFVATVGLGWQVWPFHRLSTEEVRARVDAIDSELLKRVPARSLSFATKEVLNELYRPESLFPRDPKVSSPWMSPHGVSLAYEQAMALPAPQRMAFLRTHKSKLHVLERSSLDAQDLTAEEQALASLTMTDLQSFADGAELFLSPSELWHLKDGNDLLMTYALYPRSDVERIAQSWGLGATRLSHRCDVSLGHVCFIEHPRRLALIPWLQALLILLLVLLTTLSTTLLWQRRKLRDQVQSDRELVMQTLAHELRHPVTSLQLSLEVFRDLFDQLSEKGQTEFLRMGEQVSRLRRLIETSRQYVQSTTHSGQVFEMNYTPIESINGYLQDAIRLYLDRIEFEPLIQDHEVSLDPYWLALCINNLIKNALIHGQKPVRVTVQESAPDALEIRVYDSGPVPTQALTEMTARHLKKSSTGMGLGLSLVHRIVQNMQGELIYSSHPKYFGIRLRRRHGENSRS